MLRACLLVIAVLIAPAALAGTPATFATAEQGRAVLGKRDEFVAALSAFDRSARLKKDVPVAEPEYLAFVRANVLEWNDADRQRVAAALELLQTWLHRSGLAFPPDILLIRTTGHEEGDAEYTRANAIVLPASMPTQTNEKLARVLAHELFHILSRRDAALRDKLYAAIGFQPCPEFVFPADLATRKITNPDAPHNDHRIKVAYGGKSEWAVPVLFADPPAYDLKRGGQFFDYLQLRLALVEHATQPQLVEVKDVRNFFEQVGRNTDYIIHPEEILADNFALAMSGEVAATPAIPQAILRALRMPARSAAASPAASH
jgi:hypothetical protein